LKADSHCHFFSQAFFQRLALERDGDSSPEAAAAIVRILGWEEPGTSIQLADRWVREMDRHDVARAVVIASIPADEQSVGEAVGEFPDRLVGFFMVDPTADRAEQHTQVMLDEWDLRGICLFPAMHGFDLTDPVVDRQFQVAAQHPGTAVFVHCGVLSVGVRTRLGLPCPFESFRANPLHLEGHARRYPQVPVILPHFGAGFLREALMLADLCPNVLLDTSSSNRWIRYTPGLSLKQVFGLALEVVGSRRLLFGTDSSFFPRGWNSSVYDDQLRVLQSLRLSPADQQRILGGNFARLFPA